MKFLFGMVFKDSGRHANSLPCAPRKLLLRFDAVLEGFSVLPLFIKQEPLYLPEISTFRQSKNRVFQTLKWLRAP